ncbi:unnamed protein product [Cochlearia groenlandica]
MSKKKETKLRKYMKIPIKMLVKARDLYIQSMNQLSSHNLGSGMAFGTPICNITTLPRSFSAQSQISIRTKEHRVAELVRVASARNMTIHTWHGPSRVRNAKSARSSTCDGFEKIDETTPLINFGTNYHQKMFQKSKSYGFGKYNYAIP